MVAVELPEFTCTVEGAETQSAAGHELVCRRVAPNNTRDAPMPPVLIAHGIKNRTANCKLSAELYEHLWAIGREVKLVLTKDADHGGPYFWIPQTIDRFQRFIRHCVA